MAQYIIEKIAVKIQNMYCCVYRNIVPSNTPIPIRMQNTGIYSLCSHVMIELYAVIAIYGG